MRKIIIISASVCLLLAANWAQGQDSESWLTKPRTAKQILADRLATQGMISLMGTQEPQPDQLLRARMLFDLSLQLQNDDADLWRLRAELAGLNDNQEKQGQSLREYVKLNPQDDAAQLQLIRHRIDQQQTLDARMATVSKLLASSSAGQLSAPLRSRLASYAASAAKEIGNDQQCADWLKQALHLDPANLAAATMTYQYALDHNADAKVAGSALIYLVRCNPADPMARISLAHALLAQRAYPEAIEQFTMASQLARSPLGVNDWIAMLTAMAMDGKGEQVLAAVSRTRQQLARYQAMAAQHSEIQAPKGLPATAELICVGLLHHLDRGEEANKTFDAMFQRLRKDKEAQNRFDVLLAAAVFNQETKAVEEAVKDSDLNDSQKQTLAGWLALHKGDTATALQNFDSQATDHAPAAYGQALAQSDPQQKRNMLEAMIDHWPGHPLAMLAAFDLEADQHPVKVTPTGRALLALMETLGRPTQQIWSADLTHSPWVVMHVSVDPPTSRYLEPIVVTVTLRNTSGMPMEVGPTTAIPSRLWLVIEPSIGGQSLGTQSPIVMDMQRKLTLPAGDTLTQKLRVDRSMFGQILTANPATTMTWRLNVLLDPRANANGGVEPSASGGYATITSLVAYGLPVTEENVNLWLEELKSDDAATRMQAVARLMYAAGHPSPKMDAEANRRRIVTAVDDAFAKMDRVEQAWSVGQLDLAADQAEQFISLIDAAERSDDLLVRLPYLLAQATSDGSNALMAGLRSKDAQIRQFAEALKTALERAAAEAARQQTQQAAPQSQESPQSPTQEQTGTSP